MCGRYVSVQSNADLVREFEALDTTDEQAPEPDYNVAPTKPVRIVVNRRRRDEAGQPAGAAVRQLRVASWGLIPSWSKDRRTQGKMFNARAEGVATSRAFGRAFAARRCLVPADGWYEWRPRDDGAGKQAYYMTRPDGGPLAFAGLYEFWKGDGATETTCTIITAASAGALEQIHNRMPLVLPPDVWNRWLDPEVENPSDLLASWDEAKGEHLELRPVASTVNDVRNGGPGLIESAEPPVEAPSLF